jgi:uncharacterized protein (TIGR03437 family)
MKSLAAGLIHLLAVTFVPCFAQGLPSIKSAASAGSFGAFPTIAPGTWIEIYGSNLAIDSRSWTTSDFNGADAPFELDGTKVFVGGQPAFIAYISPGQVNAQVSSLIGSGSQPVIVSTATGVSAPYSMNVNFTEPGLLAPASFNVGGIQYAAALFTDGATFALPPGSIPGVTSRRAHPGDTVTLYGIGFGAVIPYIPDGQIVDQNTTLGSIFQVRFGPTLGTVTYDGLAPGTLGLYQFNVVVPAIQSSDSVPLTFTLAGAAGTQTLSIAVQNDNATPQVESLSLSTVLVTGGGTVQGTVVLSAAAPTGGAVVALTSNNKAATVPATLTVPAGATSATFTISAGTVSSTQTAAISANYGGGPAQAVLQITSSTGTTVNEGAVINISATFSTATQISYPGYGTILINASTSGSGYGYNQVSARFMGIPVTQFAAEFNSITANGPTLSLTQSAATSGMSLGAIQASITAGSVSLTFSSSDAAGNGNVTGTFTLTTSTVIVTGTIAGTYSLL